MKIVATDITYFYGLSLIATEKEANVDGKVTSGV
jgi:hypothetical protein